MEVEGAFITAGALLPGAHSFYWLGLHVTDLPWPNFLWLDPQLPAPAVRGGSGGPGHWGTVVLEGGVVRVTEPNANYFGRDESCAGEALGWIVAEWGAEVGLAAASVVVAGSWLMP